ncbi:MAG: hypothetical protein FJ290_02695 [Planctomycetes bacterium]|nr:hypothetical protein [Planctomycetota bacterium]
MSRSRRSGGGTPLFYSVIVTRDSAGAVTIEAVPSGEVSKREKACSEEYAQAYKAYLEAKKDNPSEPKPKKASVAVLEKSVRGKDKAETLAAKYREKYDAAQAKKAEKEEATTGAKPAEGKEESQEKKEG